VTEEHEQQRAARLFSALLEHIAQVRDVPVFLFDDQSAITLQRLGGDVVQANFTRPATTLPFAPDRLRAVLEYFETHGETPVQGARLTTVSELVSKLQRPPGAG